MDVFLEIPLNKREARERGLGLRIARLVLTASDEGQNRRERAWQVVQQCRPTEKSTFIHPIGAFKSIDAVSEQLKRRNLQLQVLPELSLVQVPPNQDAAELLKLWEAEMLVIFFAANVVAETVVRSLPSLTEKWWHLTNEGPEAAYLKQLDKCDPFFFFSLTRSSVEILGSKSRVLACFDQVRSLVNQDSVVG